MGIGTLHIFNVENVYPCQVGDEGATAPNESMENLVNRDVISRFLW